jgi:hypothetical protein
VSMTRLEKQEDDSARRRYLKFLKLLASEGLSLGTF